ncbi:MAG: hypothetical protein V7746_06745 [Halioglobus sp.]
MPDSPLSRLQFYRSGSTCDEPALSWSGTVRMRAQLLKEINTLERKKEQLEQVDGKVNFCLQQTCREMIHSRRSLYRQLAR